MQTADICRTSRNFVGGARVAVPEAMRRANNLRRRRICHAGEIEGTADGGGRRALCQAWRNEGVGAQGRVEGNVRVDERASARGIRRDRAQGTAAQEEWLEGRRSPAFSSAWTGRGRGDHRHTTGGE